MTMTAVFGRGLLDLDFSKKDFWYTDSNRPLSLLSHRSQCPCPLSASTQVLKFSLSYEFCFEWCESSTDFQVARVLHGVVWKYPLHFLAVFLERVKINPLHLIHSIYGFYFVSMSQSSLLINLPTALSLSLFCVLVLLFLVTCALHLSFSPE